MDAQVGGAPVAPAAEAAASAAGRSAPTRFAGVPPPTGVAPVNAPPSAGKTAPPFGTAKRNPGGTSSLLRSIWQLRYCCTNHHLLMYSSASRWSVRESQQSWGSEIHCDHPNVEMLLLHDRASP